MKNLSTSVSFPESSRLPYLPTHFAIDFKLNNCCCCCCC